MNRKVWGLAAALAALPVVPAMSADEATEIVTAAADEVLEVQIDAGAWRAGDAGAHGAAATLMASGAPVPVLVTLAETVVPEGELSTGDRRAQRDRIKGKQDRLMGKLGVGRGMTGGWSHGPGIDKVKTLKTAPVVAMTVEPAKLPDLLADIDVAGVQLDVAAPPLTYDTLPLIGATTVHQGPGTGAGYAVVVLDTGINSAHPMLSGKVVAEACYNTSFPEFGIVSNCPNGQDEQVGTGAGIDCASTITGCGHGTHVAGIAAGRQLTLTFTSALIGRVTFSGVAPGADLIAMNVFSRFNRQVDCGTRRAPCVLSFTSDQLLALEKVVELAETRKIAAVNMSLGGGRFFDNCDTDARKPVIDTLRSLGIATVISSGNNGFTDSIGGPSCISSAITVGSSTNPVSVTFGLATAPDGVSAFSNSSPLVELLAPGDLVLSARFGGYSLLGGTSMAAPHVAGAWAVMRQLDDRPNKPAPVSEVLKNLQKTGVSITDPRNGVTVPRIDLLEAAKKVENDYHLPPQSNAAGKPSNK